MKKIVRWILIGLSTALGALVATFYAYSIYTNIVDTGIRDHGAFTTHRLSRLTDCATGRSYGVEVLCKHSLVHGKFETEEINLLNNDGEFGSIFTLRDPELVKKSLSNLVAQGLNINAIKKDYNSEPARGWTALHVAAFGGNDYMSEVEILLENGADPNIKDAKGRTPLDLAKIALSNYPNNERVKHGFNLLRSRTKSKLQEVPEENKPE